MSAMRIILSREQADVIRAAALDAFPEECCGLLIGDMQGVVHAVVPAPNIASDPARHFEIDPQILFDHMRSARKTKPTWQLFKFPGWFSALFGRAAGRPRSGMRIVGHYHSHPNGLAEPSAEDWSKAHDPYAVWVIAGVNGNAVSLRAFVPAQEGFREIPIEA